MSRTAGVVASSVSGCVPAGLGILVEFPPVITGAERLDGGRAAVRVAMGMKAALVLAFVVALIVPLDHLADKGMALRFPLFMLSTVVVPLAWGRRRFSPFPAAADTLLVAPFLADTLANLAGFYDAFGFTDDVIHALSGMLVVLAFHAWRFRLLDTGAAGSQWDSWLLGAGIGAMAIVGWEVAEWSVVEAGFDFGIPLTYGDTVGDLATSTSGGMVGSWLGVRLLGPRLQPGAA